MKKPADATNQGHPKSHPIQNLLLFLLLLLGLTGIQSARAQSFVLSNLFSLASSPDTFLNTTNNNTRGLAYNPATGHLLVVSRTGLPGVDTNAIYILNSASGATIGKLPFDPAIITGGTFVMNLIGVTDDGVIYVGNLTTDATNAAAGPFKLYRWANESAQPTLAYSGDPSYTNTVGTNPRRFGDSLALRGTGTGTQILLGTYNSVVGLLTTADGVAFTATKITTDAGAEETRRALAWGAGNTFWAKSLTGNLRQFTLNLGAQTATATLSAGLSAIYAEGLDVDVTKNLMTMIGATNHTLYLYDIVNPATPLQQDTTRTFPAPARANGNWVGSAALRSGKLFGLDVNNGILGYSINEVYLPPAIKTQPAAVTIWEGASWWTFSVLAIGNRGEPLSYQWRFNGTNIDGATASSLTLSNIAVAHEGYYSVVASNASGTVASSSALMSVTSSAPSAQVTNLWNIAADTRPYLTSGYKEYGVAISPLTTNVIVLTRQNPTNMIVVLDPLTGAEKNFIDYSALLPLSGGFNKVDVADDGIIYLCNLCTDTTGANPFKVYALSDEGPLPMIVGNIYIGDPGNGQTYKTDVWGRTMSVRGGGIDTQILLGAGGTTNKTIAILTNNGAMIFGSKAITIPDAPAGFCRLGLDWGPGTNTIIGKTASGSLVLCQFDFDAGTGFVKKIYPMTGSRSVAASVTGMKYDPSSKLMAGLQNGSPPTPVSVPVYDLSDTDAGPFWVDHELFTSYNADIEFQGNVDFANGFLVALGVNNGLKAFKINSSFTVSLPVIVSQPVGGTWFEGTSPTLTVAADSVTPLSYQWYFNGTLAIDGATSASLTITNIQASQAGNYMVRVSNVGGSRDSRTATLATLPLYNTAQMTNIWSVTAGSRPYLNTFYVDYGMAFNPMNSNIIVASWISTNTPQSIVAVMDGLTGAHKHVLDITTITNGGNRGVNKVGVAEDGVVYVANRTTTPSTVPFVVYRWANDEPTTVADVAFKGDPFLTLIPSASKNVGWTMEVRGAGVNTEILLTTGATNVVSLLTTTDGTNFTAKEILVTGAPAAFARLGVCFGAGTTFWAKAWQGDGGLLRLVQFDRVAGTGTILKTYTTAQVSSTMTTVAYNDSMKLLAGIARDDQKNVQVYNVADQDFGPVLLDQEVFPTYNASIEANGALDFGGNTYIFALNENNGIMAFLLNASYHPPVTHFKILSVVPSGADVVLTWEAQSGTTYQVQYADSLGDTPRTNWSTLGSVVATGSTASYTNTASGLKRFYQVIAQ